MRYLLLSAGLLAAGCANLNNDAAGLPGAVSAPLEEITGEEMISMRPLARDGVMAPGEIITVAAPPAPVATTSSFGTTVASLGNPAEPGLWIKTPLVKTAQQGKITAASGRSITAQLIPLDGPETAGSRLSLAAMQALGLPLTALPEVVVAPL